MTAPPAPGRLCLPLAAAAALAVAAASFAPPLPKGKDNAGARPDTEEAKPAVDLDTAATDARLARRDAANRAVSTGNLKQLGIALLYYHDVTARFPADVVAKGGKALLSWRVQLLPYLEQEELYKQLNLDEPWDSKHNRKLLEKMPKVFASPRVTLKRKGYTVYQGFTGPGAFFHSGKAARVMRSFQDGLANTIAVVEASSAVPWTKPADVPFDPKKDVPGFGKAYGGSPLALLGDGTVRTLDLRNLSKRTLKAAVTIDGGEALGGDW
jgi:hypothetical protein